MTEFQAKVRSVVGGIPVGSVMTYKEVAIAAGNPNAARAVANSMAQNFDLLIPCHRVVRSDGHLGGYNRGGAKRKRELLESEGVVI